MATSSDISQQLASQVQLAREDLRKATNAKNETMSQLDMVNSELNTATAELGRLRTELAAANEAKRDLESRVTEAQNELSSMQSQRETSRNELVTAKKELDTTEKAKRALEHRADETTHELETTKATLERYKDYLNELRPKFDKAVEDVQASDSRIKNLESKCKQLEAARPSTPAADVLDGLQNELLQWKAQYGELNTACEGLVGVLDSWHGSNHELVGQLVASRSRDLEELEDAYNRMAETCMILAGLIEGSSEKKNVD